MTVREWLEISARDVRKDGIDGVRYTTQQFKKGAFRRLDWLFSGESIYARDWEVLTVLDACRFDLIEEVYHDYDYLESIGRFNSLGRASSEWMRRNFTEEYRDQIRETVHVTGNPNSKQSIPVRDFLVLDEVWEYEWDGTIGTIYSDTIPDRAIALHRNRDPTRMIVHYIQPHHPFIENPLGKGFGKLDPWSRPQKGEIQRETVWKHYREYLEYVLDRLPVLLRNLDAENVVITADHGNLLGEYGLYAHPAKVAVPELRTVPWCEAKARDTSEYEPSIVPNTNPTADVVEQRLKDLGYR